MGSASTAGVDGFVAGLQRCGVEPKVRGGVVAFAVEAHLGALADTMVETAVAIDELARWPVVPPHWVHLPGHVAFAHTNANGDRCLPGWNRHSRNVRGWGDAAEPAQAWLAHVRSVLAEAT